MFARGAQVNLGYSGGSTWSDVESRRASSNVSQVGIITSWHIDLNGGLWCFIDFKKVCDSVRREVLYNILIAFGVHMKLLRLIGGLEF